MTSTPQQPPLPSQWLTRSRLLEELAKLGIEPSRRLGQNFLIDRHQAEAIVRCAAPKPGEHILEIGAGTGALTRLLRATGAKITAIEYDHRLAGYLRTLFQADPDVHIVQEDAARIQWDKLLGHAPYRCIANLPYAVSSPIIAGLLTAENRPRAMQFLLQRETAERLASPPGSRTYGSLSVCVQAVYQPRILRRVPATVFWPVPEVASALLQLTLREQVPTPESLQHLSRVVKAAFSQRRKKMLPLLRSRFPDSDLSAALLEQLEISPDVRAEQLSFAQFLQISSHIFRHPQ